MIGAHYKGRRVKQIAQIQISAATCGFELCSPFQPCLTSTSWPLVHRANKTWQVSKERRVRQMRREIMISKKMNTSISYASKQKKVEPGKTLPNI